MASTINRMLGAKMIAPEDLCSSQLNKFTLRVNWIQFLIEFALIISSLFVLVIFYLVKFGGADVEVNY